MARRARKQQKELGRLGPALLVPLLISSYQTTAASTTEPQPECLPATLADSRISATDDALASSGTFQLQLLEWQVNGRKQGNYFVLRGSCGEVLVRQQDTRAVRLCQLDDAATVEVDQQSYLRLDHRADIDLDIDDASQTLSLHSAGENFCPTQIDVSARPRTRLGPEESGGGFLNYRLATSKAESRDPTYDGFLGVGIFSDWGVLQSQHSAFAFGNDEIITRRIATFWKFDSPDTTTTYRFGDAFVGRTPWRSGAAIGGLQISRNYSTRPELVTGPVIDFEAIIDTQASLLLSQRGFDQPEIIGNAYFGSGYQVPPGPVEVINQPLYSNTVQTLTVREADGTISILEIPSYFTVGQLRQGFDDFEIAMGVQRQGAGDDYEQPVSLFSYRRGLSRWLTLGAGAAASQQQANAGLFAQTTVPWVGAVQTHLATSKRLPDANRPWVAAATVSNQYRGYSYSVAYEQQENGFTPSLSRAPNNSDGFRQWIGSIASRPWHGVGLRFGFQHMRPENASVRSAFTTGLNFSFSSGLRIRLSHTEQLRPDKDGFFLASFDMPLSSRPRTRGGIDASRARGGDAVVDARVGLLSSQPGHPSVQLRHRLEGGDLTAVSASVERPAYGAFASAVDSAGARSVSAGVVGGVVAARGIVKPTRFASGGFALVDLGPELAGVRVNAVPTDSKGRSLLVGLPAFQETTLHVNQRDLPYNTTLNDDALIAAPKDLSLVRVTPNFLVFRDALVPIIVVAENGERQPLSTAATVIDLNAAEAQPLPVGMDGLIYLSSANEQAQLLVMDNGMELCEITVAIPPVAERTPELAPITCAIKP